ncbi:hypothetical protein DL346_10980 [Paenibacillus montanisoli]|uniref:Uncharacterized protein n=1 Tax=Paenibacillus montanisoli TaxID=2081970 RepID=A0A328U4U2_9BACL|nr:hypothetical protein DL346_10980 [Paenibacillus montanisoli]
MPRNLGTASGPNVHDPNETKLVSFSPDGSVFRFNGINSMTAAFLEPFRNRLARKIGRWPLKQFVGEPAFCPEKFCMTILSFLLSGRVIVGAKNRMQAIQTYLPSGYSFIHMSLGSRLIGRGNRWSRQRNGIQTARDRLHYKDIMRTEGR